MDGGPYSSKTTPGTWSRNCCNVPSRGISSVGRRRLLETRSQCPDASNEKAPSISATAHENRHVVRDLRPLESVDSSYYR